MNLKAISKLEHHTRGGISLHGQNKAHIHLATSTALVAYGGAEVPVTGADGLPVNAEEEPYIFVSGCYWTHPESYDDELLEEVLMQCARRKTPSKTPFAESRQGPGPKAEFGPEVAESRSSGENRQPRTSVEVP